MHKASPYDFWKRETGSIPSTTFGRGRREVSRLRLLEEGDGKYPVYNFWKRETGSIPSLQGALTIVVNFERSDNLVNFERSDNFFNFSNLRQRVGEGVEEAVGIAAKVVPTHGLVQRGVGLHGVLAQAEEIVSGTILDGQRLVVAV